MAVPGILVPKKQVDGVDDGGLDKPDYYSLSLVIINAVAREPTVEVIVT